MRALLLAFFAACSLCGQAAKADRWAPLSFLVGEWVGEGGGGPGQGSGGPGQGRGGPGQGRGGPGQGSGGFSFLPEQDGNVLVRKNWADYPASKNQPAYSHTDLMVVYEEDGKLRAIYFDSEGHVIHYEVEAGDGSSVRFLSKGYRLSYRRTGVETVGILFEVADGGGGFRTYIQASARKKR